MTKHQACHVFRRTNKICILILYTIVHIGNIKPLNKHFLPNKLYLLQLSFCMNI